LESNFRFWVTVIIKLQEMYTVREQFLLEKQFMQQRQSHYQRDNSLSS